MPRAAERAPARMKAACAAATGLCGPGGVTGRRGNGAERWLSLGWGRQGEARANTKGAARPAGVESRHLFPG